jgi:hypothetical protein
MNSTLKGSIPPYLGVDPTDRYSRRCRPADVCGLMPGDNDRLKAFFWFWQRDTASGALDLTAIVNELKATRAAMFDGPRDTLRNTGNAFTAGPAS